MKFKDLFKGKKKEEKTTAGAMLEMVQNLAEESKEMLRKALDEVDVNFYKAGEEAAAELIIYYNEEGGKEKYDKIISKLYDYKNDKPVNLTEAQKAYFFYTTNACQGLFDFVAVTTVNVDTLKMYERCEIPVDWTLFDNVDFSVCEETTQNYMVIAMRMLIEFQKSIRHFEDASPGVCNTMRAFSSPMQELAIATNLNDHFKKTYSITSEEMQEVNELFENCNMLDAIMRDERSIFKIFDLFPYKIAIKEMSQYTSARDLPKLMGIPHNLENLTNKMKSDDKNKLVYLATMDSTACSDSFHYEYSGTLHPDIYNHGPTVCA